MRHYILYLGAALLAGAAYAQSYNVTTSQISTYTPIVGGTDLQLGDDTISPAISPPGFSFSFFGQNFTSFKVGSNGYVSLGNQGTTTSPTPNHDAAPGFYVAPFWTDLMPGIGANWRISWLYQSGVLAVEFSDVAQRNPTPTFGTFAVRMTAYMDTATGEIYFRYGQPNVGTVTVNAFSNLPNCVAISGPAGPSQEIIVGALPGYVNPDGSVPQYPLLHEIRFTPSMPVPPLITSQPVTSVEAGNQYSYTIVATGNPPPQISAIGLPAWLSLVGDTLEGMPTAADAGSHGPITVSATNSAGQDDQIFMIDVELAPNFTSAPVTSVVASSQYTYNITVAGHPAPALGASGLPPWLNLIGSTLSGTPSTSDTGSHGPITLTASNALGQDDQVFQIEVQLAPAITSSPVTSVVVGDLYSYSVTADGYPAPAISASGLPGWLTLVGNTLQGTPQPGDLGTHGPITVSAVNAAGQDDQVFSIDVTPVPVAPKIVSTPNLEATVGSLYSYSLVATGTPMPNFSATGLPGWLTLTDTTLSGTPAASDVGKTGPITITATNSEGSDDQVFEIAVRRPRSSGNGGDSGCSAGASTLLMPAALLGLAAWRRRRRSVRDLRRLHAFGSAS